MSTRRILALVLATTLAAGSMPGVFAAQQENGSVSGKATSEAKAPYSNYLVQLRDPATAQVIRSGQLTDRGLFTIGSLPLSRRFIVELYNVRENRVVCTEGPYLLVPQDATRTNIDINCGTSPAWWLLLAGAGAAASIATLTASGG
jgi:hypothetical protein